MRKLLNLIVIGSALAIFAPARAAPPMTLSVAVFPGGANWPIWVAAERGFFAANGLTVTVAPTPNSVAQMTGLIEGKFDIAMTAADNLVAYDEGQGEAQVAGTPDLVAVMGGDSGLLNLVTIPDIAGYEGLKGRELSVDAKTTGYAFVLMKMLEMAGLREGDYRLVRAGGVLQRFEALQKREHAGTLLVSPFELALEPKGFHRLGRARDTLGHYQGVVGGVRRGWAVTHTAELVAYIRGYLAALDWLYQPANRAEAIAIYRNNLPKVPLELAERSYDVLLDPADGLQRDARIDLEGVRTVLALRSQYGEPRRTLTDPSKYYDGSYYQKARE
jgi:ABC-type nitrate/sulfonate/bicarbonate transport system substrate-binding protein